MSAVHTTSARPGSTDEARHEHSWTTDSRHPTSAGWVLYVRCAVCGTHRVDVQGHRETPPAPLSRVVGGASVRASS
jgi:hypothetical protein